MSEQATAQSWDKEAIYDAEISPLVARLIAICKSEGIPMIASFQYGYDADADESMLCTTHIPGNNEAPALQRAHAAIISDDRLPMMVTTRNADGRVTRMEAIL